MVRLNYVSDEGSAFNVLHYQIAATSGAVPGPFATLAAIGEAAESQFGSVWAAGASDEVTFLGASVQNVYPAPRSKLVTYTVGSLIPGAINANALPMQDAPTILKDTDFGQRWGLGRLFFPGIPETMAEKGEVIAGLSRTALTTMATRLAQNLDVVEGTWTMTLNPVLYHAATAATDTKPATAHRVTRIVSARVPDWTIKSMKTRRRGKGI